MIAVIIAWVIGIGCIFLMKKIQPGGWIAYAIYVLVVLILLTALGAKATVVQGDTLCEPYVQGVTPEYRILRTPMKTGALI